MAPRSHKQQTRLTFNPLSSSSPAKAQYSDAVQDRLSGVGYSGHPPKKRIVAFDTDDSDDQVADSSRGVNILPTPAKSSQRLSSSAKRHKSGTQGRLDFSGHIGTRLEREDDEEDRRQKSTAKSATPRRLSSNPFRGTNSSPVDVSEDSSSEDSDSEDDDIPHHSSPPPASRTTRSSRNHVHEVDDAGSEDHEKEQAGGRTRPSRREGNGRATLVVSSDEEVEAGKDEDWSSVLGSDAPATVAKSHLDDIGEPETSGDEVMRSSPMRKTGRRNGRARGKTNRTTGRNRDDGFIVDDDEIVEESDEEEDEPPRKSKSTRKAVETEGSDDDDVALLPVKRRRLTQRDAPSSTRKDKEEADDLAEDLEFLGSVKDSPSRLRSSISNGKPNARQQAMEEFRRRRAGIASAPSSSAPRPSTSRPKALYDTESEADDDDNDDVVDEDDEENEGPEPVPTAREMFQEIEGEDDFIDEDEDPLGVPDADAQLPLAFSNLRFARAKDLFKYAIEWMVQKKLNPAFSMTDEVYSLAFTKLDDEACGLAGSKFMSSAWTPDFHRALKARPGCTAIETGSDGIHHCEACNRKTHPATWIVHFNGNPYSTQTLEDLEQDDDDDDEDEDDSYNNPDSEGSAEKLVYDSLGNLLPPTTRGFHLGRTCQQNASTAHTLAHWRYNLNQWVVDYLGTSGYLKPERIVERDAWATKKRRKFANKVTDEMEENGQIKTLYKVFKAEIEAAHEAKGSGYERY